VEPWTTDSDPLTFRVDSKAEVASVTPADGTVLTGGGKDTNFVLALDRPADPATVNKTNVVLDRNAESSGGDPDYTVGCSATPCTSIVVDPNGSLPEGRYVLSMTNVKSDEGATFATFSARYAVPFVEGGSIAQASSAFVVSCTPGVQSSSAFTVNSPGPENGTLDFDLAYSGAGGWTMQAVYNGNNPVGTPLSGAAAGHYQLTFPISSSGPLTFRLTVGCAGSTTATASASNLVGSRVP
jgi:hypothetical protein